MIKKQSYKHAEYDERNKTLIVNKKSYSLWHDNILDDVKVKFHKEGFIEISAQRLIGGHSENYDKDLTIDEINLVEEKYKELYTVGFLYNGLFNTRFFKKQMKMRIKDGWYVYKKRESFKLYSNNLTIIDKSSVV